MHPQIPKHMGIHAWVYGHAPPYDQVLGYMGMRPIPCPGHWGMYPYIPKYLGIYGCIPRYPSTRVCKLGYMGVRLQITKYLGIWGCMPRYPSTCISAWVFGDAPIRLSAWVNGDASHPMPRSLGMCPHVPKYFGVVEPGLWGARQYVSGESWVYVWFPTMGIQTSSKIFPSHSMDPAL